MKIWYTCKAKYGKEMEDGVLKQVTEAYLVDAVSYTEAESRIYAAMEQNIAGEFSITAISKTNISDVINYEDCDDWYKCKVSYSTVDGDSEKEIKVNTYLLVSAENVKQAYERVDDNMSSMLVPFDIPSIIKTNIMEVFPFMEEEEANVHTPAMSEMEEEEVEEVSEEVTDEVTTD
ncbi:MAG: DUF4494 domain-containing protein [Bacteroidota bacterium]